MKERVLVAHAPNTASLLPRSLVQLRQALEDSGGLEKALQQLIHDSHKTYYGT